MGQYERWLHYQEVDRQLRAELEALETELASFQRSMQDHPTIKTSSSNSEASTGQAALQTQNIVIRALDWSLNGYSSTADDALHEAGTMPAHLPLAHSTTTNGYNNEQQTANSNSAITSTANAMQPKVDETISPSLMNWGALPNFGPNEIEGASPAMEQPGVPSTLHSENVLLPEDMPTFIDEHAQTDPQPGLPWWLRSKAFEAPVQRTAGGPAPIDPEPTRTNRLVQRWMKRREHLSPQSPEVPANGKPEEGMHDE
jgi:hypothetical protein